jgi:chemotaxis regulatin CheY-phosphate phosphatase CheZ
VRSSVKSLHPANDNLKDDLIRHTRQVWQPRLGRDLSREDARQIAENMTGFFSVLAEWTRAERPTPANDPG